MVKVGRKGRPFSAQSSLGPADTVLDLGLNSSFSPLPWLCFRSCIVFTSKAIGWTNHGELQAWESSSGGKGKELSMVCQQTVKVSMKHLQVRSKLALKSKHSFLGQEDWTVSTLACGPHPLVLPASLGRLLTHRYSLES